ncbi:MAG: DUF368 domain-containing protein [Cetobacterium sp.]|uniref:DUF368 domain-containing protein n=1 Tax=Cetobacterium sp. TaxID=2071632 RepID=UPI003F34E4ED
MFLNILKGILIGIANVLPGVSGGTLAVMLGIYDKLTEAVGNFLIVPIKEKITYSKFLIQIAIGAAIGILLFARIIEFSYLNYPKITTIIFVILMLPSIPFIIKGENIKNRSNILSLIAGILFTIGFLALTYFIGEETIEASKNIIFSFSYGIKLFFCGLIAAGAMIIPGISGSLLLLILGEYYNILSFISSFNILPLIFFGAGTGIGLIFFSKIINILLNKYRSFTLFFIVGIILVSLVDMVSRAF